MYSVQTAVCSVQADHRLPLPARCFPKVYLGRAGKTVRSQGKSQGISTVAPARLDTVRMTFQQLQCQLSNAIMLPENMNAFLSCMPFTHPVDSQTLLLQTFLVSPL